MTKCSIYFNIVFLLIVFIEKTLCKKQSLVIPYKVYRLPENEKATKEDIYESFERNYIYTLFDVGNPSQKLPIVYHFNNSYFRLNEDMNFAFLLNSNYSPSNSQSFKNLDKNLDTDDFAFIVNKEKSIKNLKFYNAKKEKKEKKEDFENFYTYAGLQNFYVENRNKKIDKSNFLYQLKSLGLIDYISFSINQTTEEEGFININLEPYEFEPNLYSDNKKYKYTTNIRGVESRIINKSTGEYLWSLEIVSVYYKNKDNKVITLYIDHFDMNEDQYAVLLNPAYGLIKGPYEFKTAIEKDFFSYFMKNNICTSSKVRKLYFYSCDAKYKDKLKKQFPSIKFNHQEINYTYVLDFEDLFIEKNGILYFLICYDRTIYGDDKFAQISEWVLGKPFLKKYQFSFDVEKNKINFYINKNGYPPKKLIRVKNDSLNKTIDFKKIHEFNIKRTVYVTKLMHRKNLGFIALSLFIIFVSFFCISYNLRAKQKKVIAEQKKAKLDEEKVNVELKESLDDINN